MLTDKRRRILRCLDKINERNEACPSAYEVAIRCGEHRTASDWAIRPLADMAEKGWTERVGVTVGNARTWRITEAGRAALAHSVDA
jgi:hypothetical protein